MGEFALLDDNNNVSQLIVNLYSEWEKKSPTNNQSKLAKKMGTNFTSVRMMVQGAVKKPRFWLFDKFLRAIDVSKEKYIEYATRYYPEYANAAKRFSCESGKEPNCENLRWLMGSHLAKDIYQQLLSGKHYGKNYFHDKYGDEGERIVKRLLECEEVFYDEKHSKYFLRPEEKQIEAEMHFEMLKHNALNYCPDDAVNGSGSSLKQLYASDECIDSIKIMLRDALDKAWMMSIEDQKNNKSNKSAFAVNFMLNVLD